MKTPRRPTTFNEADIPELNRIMQEHGRRIPNTLEGKLTDLSRQSGGIPSFVREAMAMHGVDPDVISRAHQMGSDPAPNTMPVQAEEPDEDISFG